MAATDQQILDAINDALLAIISGKVDSVGASGRNLVNLGIDKLQAMKREYEAAVSAGSNAENGGGIALVRFGEAQ